ncbi:hypothetical protein AUR64_07580 [Haloprofundus marisrubri]|uniref:DUF2206 domain-containing protein n=2 Tax=Haloprofundus marisrubri TaxID=1514971 RepID=A0A0W1RD30_9EURY|nr:hypothetical protein AUR64_07580 [Haloprofundus marisrubri]
MPVEWSPKATVTFIAGLLVAFWGSTLVPASSEILLGVRILTASALFLFLPGALLVRLLNLRVGTFGPFTILSVGLSFALVAIVTVLSGLTLPVFGVSAPLAFVPLALVLTLVVVALAVLVSSTETTLPRLNYQLDVSPMVLALVAFLPGIAALAAIVMNQFGSNLGMYVFVLATAAIVMLALLQFIPQRLYPFSLFVVSVSMLLHRNLLSGHVIGADIQSMFYTATVVGSTHVWGPAIGGSSIAVPMVSAVPASVTILTGIELTTTYKVVYVLLFALAPVGLFYLTREIFDTEIALYGSLFFTLYHLSFYFTPDKQLIAELFVVALLLVYFGTYFETLGSKLAGVLLAVGLIYSHYGVTYVFGFSLLAAVVGLFVVQRVVGDVEHRLSLTYPVLLLFGATAWYAYSSPELIATLQSVPLSLADQVVTLLRTGLVEGSGGSYVSEGSGTLDDMHLALYILFTMLLSIGLAWQVLAQLYEIHTGRSPKYVEYTALAVPLFIFLGSSYFFTLNLWADRAYQIVLVVLAPFMPIGYRVLVEKAGALSRRVTPQAVVPEGASWTVLAVLLVILLAFNSGFLFAAIGTSHSATFNSDAHDYVFSNSERAGAGWLIANTNVSETEAYQTGDVERPQEIPVFTDIVTSQMLRSELPESYYNTETRHFKDEWSPQFEIENIDRGYVYIRERGVSETNTDVPTSRLSSNNETAVTSAHNVVYSSGSVTVVSVRPAAFADGTMTENGTTTNETNQQRLVPAIGDSADVPHRTTRGASERV